ncbi:MAG: hypothetical protein ACR2QK_03350, partial [Acidimicrobiales bacterium]
LPWGVVLCLLYVAGQQLSDAAALRGGGGVVRSRALAIAAEWSGLLVGAVLAGTAGLAVGWVIGLAVATAIWVQAWVHPSPRP